MTRTVELSIGITKVFVKNQKAIEATNDDGSRKYRYIINEGSSRSSKTHSLCQTVHKYACDNPHKRIGVFRDTKKDCRDTIGSDFKKEFPSLTLGPFVDFNKTEAVYSFPNESVIEINGTDEPNKLHGYNSDVIWVNEPYNMSKDTFDQLDMRAADFVIIDWNPQQSHWIDDLKKDSRAIIIHSTFRDNPFCPIEQKLKILSYQPVKASKIVEEKKLSDQEARTYDFISNPLNFSAKEIKELYRCIENERKNSANLFKWMVYGLGLKAERPNRIFHWNEISDADYNAIDAVKYYGHDWGTVDPWGILEAKYYDGALYLHELNYKSENQIKEELTHDVLQMLYDPNDQENLSLVKWYCNKLGINKKSYQICDTNRPMKILALHNAGYNYALEAPKPPGSIIDGIDLLNGIRVYYTASSTNLKYEQENYSRMVDRYGIVLDEPEDTNNHLMDPARYIALFLVLMGIIKR
jgi:phage terminase large subunit